MKKIFLAIAVSLFFASSFGQKISKITISKDGSFELLSLVLDENVTVTMDNEGAIKAWGIEIYSDRIPTMSKLDAYPGRVEYYPATDNEAFRGKVKYIGRTLITYYGSYDMDAFRGKVKSIGNSSLEYYSSYDNDLLKGRLKKIGSAIFNWYTSFDNESFRGKLKSVGSTALNYYASFDDKAIRGKIKSIDRAQFTYYLSTERKDYEGMIKTGIQLQTINGILFHVRF